MVEFLEESGKLAVKPTEAVQMPQATASHDIFAMRVPQSLKMPYLTPGHTFVVSKTAPLQNDDICLVSLEPNYYLLRAVSIQQDQILFGELNPLVPPLSCKRSQVISLWPVIGAYVGVEFTRMIRQITCNATLNTLYERIFKRLLNSETVTANDPDMEAVQNAMSNIAINSAIWAGNIIPTGGSSTQP